MAACTAVDALEQLVVIVFDLSDCASSLALIAYPSCDWITQCSIGGCICYDLLHCGARHNYVVLIVFADLQDKFIAVCFSARETFL